MGALIDLANEVLIVTNVWIFFYHALLKILNATFRLPPLQDKFIRQDYSPEPFEIPLYLALTALTVIALFLYYRLLKPRVKLKIPLLLKLCGFALLVFILITNLGTYPMAHDLYPYQQDETPLTYLLFWTVYLSFIVFLLIESAILEKLIGNKKNLLPLFFLLVIGIVGFITFEPRFPMVGHDYSYFFGPVWEIVHGKTIYTQVPSQYGFLSVLILALLYKLQLINLWYLPALIWSLYIAQYGVIFYLILKVSRSLVLSLLGLFSLITINYLSLFHLPGTIIQIGPMRWLPLIASLVIFYRIKKIDSKLLIFLISLLSFLIIDTGISLLLAYVCTLFILMLSRQLDLIKAAKSVFFLIGCVILIFVVINVIHVFLGYKIIDLFKVFGLINEYARAGFGMIPIGTKSYFWLVMLIYFALIIYFFKNSSFTSKISHPTSIILLLFSANLSLFASIYFVGRSHPHNLFHIALFFLINAFLLVGTNFNNIKSSHLKLFILIVLFFVFIVYPLSQRQEVMTKMVLEKAARYKLGTIFTPEAKTILESKYKEEISLIKNNFPGKKILILSDDDTYLFYLTNKENMLYDNSQITILSEEDLKNSLKDVFLTCPKKIIADCRLFNRCHSSDPFDVTNFYIQPILLSKIQNSCHSNYYPTRCTSHLCLAEAR